MELWIVFVFVFVCRQVKDKKSNINHSGNFWDTYQGLQGLAGCTSFASSDSKACSTSKLLVFCENALAKQHTALLHKLDTTKESWPDFTESAALLRAACLWVLLAAQQQTLPPADNRFLGQLHSQGQSSAASATDVICRIGLTRIRVLGLAGRSAS